MNTVPSPLDRTCKFAWTSTGLGLLLTLVAWVLPSLGLHQTLELSGFWVTPVGLVAGPAACFLAAGAVLQARLLLKLASYGPSPSLPKVLVAILCVAMIGVTLNALRVMGDVRRAGSVKGVATLVPTNDAERAEQVQVELQTLEGALVGYRMIHGKWPVPVQTNADTILGVEAHQAFVETVLKGVGPGTFAGVFIGMRPESFTQGKLLDPWGHPYHIVLDSNGDGVCDTDAIGPIKGREVVAWSDGPGKVYLQPQVR